MGGGEGIAPCPPSPSDHYEYSSKYEYKLHTFLVGTNDIPDFNGVQPTDALYIHWGHYFTMLVQAHWLPTFPVWIFPTQLIFVCYMVGAALLITPVGQVPSSGCCCMTLWCDTQHVEYLEPWPGLAHEWLWLRLVAEATATGCFREVIKLFETRLPRCVCVCKNSYVWNNERFSFLTTSLSKNLSCWRFN